MLRYVAGRAGLALVALALVACSETGEEASGDEPGTVASVAQAVAPPNGAGGEAGASSGAGGAPGSGCNDDTECEACEECVGAPGGTCQLRTAGFVCRPADSARACDQAEVCDGVNPTCPADVGLPAGTVCRAADPLRGCDAEEVCAGGTNLDCPADVGLPAGTVCRAADPLRGCDAEEVCAGGTNLDCPPNVGLPANTVCRPANPALACDQEEVCVGGTNLDCPPDIGRDSSFVCRPAAGPCDVEERCGGLVEDCPPDNFRAAGVECRASTEPNCDPAEVCTGTGPECPPDFRAQIGTLCDDGDACTGNQPGPTLPDTCDGNGACIGGTPTVCTALGPCYDVGVCLPASGDCTNPPKPSGSPCTDNVACTEDDRCDGSGTCVPGTQRDDVCPERSCAIADCEPVVGCVYTPVPPRVCRPVASGLAGACDLPESCNGVDLDCPPDTFRPAGTVCQPAACVNNGTAADVLAVCDGVSAACVVEPDQNCAPYVCENSVCRTSCLNDGDCQTAFYCSSGTCIPRTGAGQPCTSAVECTVSNPYCVDGVCCNSACQGQCEACNVPGFEGSCTGVSGEPVAPRPPCNGDGTVCDGHCDPSNRTSCEYPSTSVQCRAPSCDATTDVALPRSFCDGRGECALGDPVPCAPYGCGETQCRGNCTIDGHCAEGSFCNAGMCTEKGEPGESCDSAVQCRSGFCVDGVCCDSRCDGQCEACNVAGSEGTCSAVSGPPVGSRPACLGTGECAGTCDGSSRTSCAYPGAETECRAAACADGTAILAAACDGRGSCPAERTVSCPAECSGPICAGGCSIDADCPSGQHCTAGVCTPKAGPGTSCGSGSECESGHCVDGVCCDSACLGQCEACDVAGSVGTCSPVPAGEAPHGTRTRCTSDGSPCGGSCDGSNRMGCAYPVGVQCRAPMCAAATASADAVSVVEALCTGTGHCPAEQQQGCGNFGCDPGGTVCAGPCATDPDACPSTEYCSAGVCVPRKDAGTSCGSDAECATGFCTDGVCCNSRCDGQCEACDAAGSLGTCSPVSGAARGGRPACPGSGPCAAECNGVNADACTFPGPARTCGAAHCSNGVRTEAASCNGAGICEAGESVTCSSFQCNGAECGSGCTSDADCTGDNVCLDFVCQKASTIDAVDKGSCGCRVVGQASGASGTALGALALAAMLAVRRRRRVELA